MKGVKYDQYPTKY